MNPQFYKTDEDMKSFESRKVFFSDSFHSSIGEGLHYTDRAMNHHKTVYPA